MAVTKLDIRIGAMALPVGELIHDVSGDRETSIFTYHESWLQHPGRFALAPDMELSAAPIYTSKTGNASALPGPVADGAPDSWGRAIIRSALGRGHLSDLDYLIEADDFLRSGALRYFTGPGQDATPLAAPRAGSRGFSVPRLVDLEQIIAEARAFEADPVRYRETRAKLLGGEILKQAAGSLGGARPKVNARDSEDRLWIVKLAKMDDAYAMARAEVLTLKLAAAVGLSVSEAEVLNTSQKFPVALVKRFDRSPKGARVPFISGQTFMGLAGTEPSTYVDIAYRLREHGSDPVADMAELWARMSFSILVQNVDDHLRNHGFILGKGGKWHLSPAFDINPDPEEGGTMKTGISDIHGTTPDIEAAIEAAPFFDITEDAARQRVSEMAGAISASWRTLGGKLGMTSSDFRAVAPAFESRQIDLARRLGERTVPSIALDQ